VIFWLNTKQQRLVGEDPYEVIRQAKMSQKALSAGELLVLAAAHERLGELKQAETICRQALTKSLHFPECFFSLSLLSFRQRKYPDAQRWFLRAVKSKRESVAADVFNIEQKLKTYLSVAEAGHWGLWCLREFHRSCPSTPSTQFELGKLLFERSDYQGAVEAFLSLVEMPEFSYEASQYLSYLYERLYKGEELVRKTLELAEKSSDRADLFFNLAMVCQHDTKLQDSALHYFYLAKESEPDDPGLRFSLEQACIEYIGKTSEPKSLHQAYYLMMAHFYHGSTSVAERYAGLLQSRFHIKDLAQFQSLHLPELWNPWLTRENSPFAQSLLKWFPAEVVGNPSKIRQLD
jgi:tetratricopeptide (TPR) repeat protein